MALLLNQQVSSLSERSHKLKASLYSPTGPLPAHHKPTNQSTVLLQASHDPGASKHPPMRSPGNTIRSPTGPEAIPAHPPCRVNPVPPGVICDPILQRTSAASPRHRGGRGQNGAWGPLSGLTGEEEHPERTRGLQVQQHHRAQAGTPAEPA